MSFEVALSEVLVWVLASVRLIALFTIAPFFGHTAVSRRFRVAFALLVTWAIGPVASSELVLELDLVPIAAAVASEALIGFSMGLLAELIFSAFAMLGEFVSIQGGLGAARVVDPSSGASSVALAAAFQAFAVLTFLAIDGHHSLIRSAAESFERIPVGGGPPEAGLLAGIALSGASVFRIAAQLSLPMTVAMMVANAALGLLGRAIPQLNLMTLQLPAHVALLLLMVLVGARPLTDAMASILGPWMTGLSASALGPR